MFGLREDVVFWDRVQLASALSPSPASRGKSGPQGGSSVVDSDLHSRSRHRGLFVVDKPADMCVDESEPLGLEAEHGHSAHASSRRTHNVLQLARETIALSSDEAGSAVGEVPCPHLCHQLDLATSGLLALALDAGTARSLSDLFAARRVSKRYLAVVHGHLPPGRDAVLLDWPVARSPDRGKASGSITSAVASFAERLARPSDDRPQSAVSVLHVLSRGFLDAECTHPAMLVSLVPISGRRHQLRLHTHRLGHSILGDLAYAPADADPRAADMGAERMMLHAWKMDLPIAAQESHASSSFCPSDTATLIPLSSTPQEVTPEGASRDAWLSLETRVQPFAHLLHSSVRTSFHDLHARAASRVLAPSWTRAIIGGVVLILPGPPSSDDGRPSSPRPHVLLRRMARAHAAVHHHHVEAEAGKRPSRGVALKGSIWTLPHAPRIPDDADTADTAARALATIADVRPIMANATQIRASIDSCGPVDGATADENEAASLVYAHLQLARLLRRGSRTLGLIEAESDSRHQAYFVMRTNARIEERNDVDAVTRAFPLEDVLRAIEPVTQSTTDGAVAAAPTQEDVFISGGRTFFLAPLVREWLRRPSVRGMIEEIACAASPPPTHSSSSAVDIATSAAAAATHEGNSQLTRIYAYDAARIVRV